MKLFAYSGDTFAMFITRKRKPPETIEYEGREWRVTSWLPSRASDPDPGVIDAQEPENG